MGADTKSEHRRRRCDGRTCKSRTHSKHKDGHKGGRRALGQLTLMQESKGRNGGSLGGEGTAKELARKSRGKGVLDAGP